MTRKAPARSGQAGGIMVGVRLKTQGFRSIFPPEVPHVASISHQDECGPGYKVLVAPTIEPTSASHGRSRSRSPDRTTSTKGPGADAGRGCSGPVLRLASPHSGGRRGGRGQGHPYAIGWRGQLTWRLATSEEPCP